MKKTLIILTLISGRLLAQDLQQSALENFNNQQWEAASKNYLKYLKKNDGDSADWYNLAVSQGRLKKYDKAIESFNEAKKRNFNPGFIYYALAKIYAEKEDKESVITMLKEGAENGLGALARLKSDSSFESYQQLPQFQAVLEKVKLNAYPCLSAQDYRHFDFWLGEWDVFAGGRKAGENYITMAQGGCAIHENYVTQGNYAGQSINYYDPIDKKWHQHWVGSSGDVYNYLETKREEGLLQFESKFMGRGGNISLSRLTFSLNDDGTVRQLFESSTDGGKTWSPAFDGLYKKKK